MLVNFHLLLFSLIVALSKEAEKESPVKLGKEDGYHIWWNIPTAMCRTWGLDFSVISKLDIQQNKGDKFHGDKIVILYDPGFYPTLHGPKNGGLPQEGNLKLHLQKFEEYVNKAIPDTKFSGLAVIDFEDWRPIFHENWGTLNKYRNKSLDLERERHPDWSDKALKLEAERRFEKAAFSFFEETLDKAKQMRPKAKWGYYGFPFCFNYSPKHDQMYCPSQILKDNDRSKWIYKKSTALFPSVYFHMNVISEEKRVKFMQGRLNEAVRIAKKANPVLPIFLYVTFIYPDIVTFYNKDDMKTSLLVPKNSGASGAIIWGSSNFTNSNEKCQDLLKYSVDIIGPIVKSLGR